MAFLNYKNYKNFLRILSAILMIFIFNGCSNALLNPSGKIAKEESSLILISFVMMLFVIVPVICMTLYFSIKYRSNNTNQIYKPNWSHSNKIELAIWGVPILIVSILAFLSWNYTHKLEPKKAIVSFHDPVKIDVIALDWKWLFIYPDYHVATINEIMFPVNKPIVFRITSNSVMNAFFIPDLGSQIYAMPGMMAKLNLIADKPGKYQGISSNYSGNGFSNMKFTAISVLENITFQNWINQIKNSSKKLDTLEIFNKISIPNEKYSVEYFSNVQNNLFDQIIKTNFAKNFYTSKKTF